MSGVVLRFIDKATAMDAVADACQRGECQPQDAMILWSILTGIDRETGECTRHYETIGARCGMSRSAAGRSIKRLVDAGIIERKARAARNRGQIATAFTVAGRPARGTPPSRIRDAHKGISQGLLYPMEGRPIAGKASMGAPPGPEPDWNELADWLAEAGQYRKQWGTGAEELAVEDLQRWRGDKGDRAILRAINTARDRGLFGPNLIDFLEKTYPGRRTAA